LLEIPYKGTEGRMRGLNRADAAHALTRRRRVAVRALAMCAGSGAVLLLAGCGRREACCGQSFERHFLHHSRHRFDRHQLHRLQRDEFIGRVGGAVYGDAHVAAARRAVTWKVSGGDANSGAGTITASGQYTPPSYLTADSVPVTVTATLASNQRGGERGADW
jgi:hypothetical protein